MALVEPITNSVIVAIEGVDHTAELRGNRYVVHATSAEKSWQFVTWNAWVASLCEGAKQSQHYVRIIYQKQRRMFGFWLPRIIRAELVEHHAA